MIGWDTLNYIGLFILTTMISVVCMTAVVYFKNKGRENVAAVAFVVLLLTGIVGIIWTMAAPMGSYQEKDYYQRTTDTADIVVPLLSLPLMPDYCVPNYPYPPSSEEQGYCMEILAEWQRIELHNMESEQ